MNRDYIILLVGKSGTGKTTIQNILAEKYGLKPLESYTTRPPRYENEQGHTFVSDEEFDKLKSDMCAYTEFHGFRYCSTNQQVEESDVYVIDPAGVAYFKRKYKGNKQVVVVELLAQKHVRFQRMINRGDGWLKATSRLRHDKKAFAHNEATITINANTDDPIVVADNVYTTTQLYIALGEVGNE